MGLYARILVLGLMTYSSAALAQSTPSMGCQVFGTFLSSSYYLAASEFNRRIEVDVPCPTTGTKSLGKLTRHQNGVTRSIDYNCTQAAGSVSCQRIVNAEICLNTSATANWEIEKQLESFQIDIASGDLLLNQTFYKCVSRRLDSQSTQSEKYRFLYDPRADVPCDAKKASDVSITAANGLTYYAKKWVERDTMPYYRISACKGDKAYLPFQTRGTYVYRNDRPYSSLGKYDEFLGFTLTGSGGAILWGVDDHPGSPSAYDPAWISPAKALTFAKLNETDGSGLGRLTLPNADKIEKIALVRLVDENKPAVVVKITYKGFGSRVYEISPEDQHREILE